jgi:hypothetical protein
MKKEILSMWDLFDEISNTIEKHTRKIKKYSDEEGDYAYLGETLDNHTVAFFYFKDENGDFNSAEINIDMDKKGFRKEWSKSFWERLKELG